MKRARAQNDQSGFSHELAIVVSVAIILFIGLGFSFWQNFRNAVPVKVDVGVNEQRSDKGINPAASNPVADEISTLEIANAGNNIKITYPTKYSYKKIDTSKDESSCGPYYSSINFYNTKIDMDKDGEYLIRFGIASKDSILPRGFDGDTIAICSDSDIVTKADFEGLKKASLNSEPYKARSYGGSNYEQNGSMITPQKINSNYWYLESYKNSNGFVSRYTAFLGDTLIDSYVNKRTRSDQQIDTLFNEFTVSE